MTLVAESERLHERVRALAREDRAVPDAEFDALALDIARYQMRHIAGFRRLVAAHAPSGLRAASDIPAVPVDAFRLTRVATHPADLDVVRFATSGTTGAAPGVHAMRTTETYRLLSLAWGRKALASAWSGRRVVVALAPWGGDAPTSSLGFMMRAFMEDLDGRVLADETGTVLDGRDAGAVFDVGATARWLASPSGVDVEGLRRAADLAGRRGEPLLVLATGFALVLLLDALAGKTLAAPARTVVMPTGGFKGRTREIGARELAQGVARAFGVPESHIVGEYGMTELSSQLYEGTLPGGALAAPPGVFVPPPWLRVTPVDAETLAPVKEGEIGLARFVDLGNVDSAVAIVTQDRVRRAHDGRGIELRGRASGATPRGCSLAIEEMVVGAGSVIP